jgi:dTDP-4-dehydrorhamnose 3,5-epimerase
MQIIPTQFDDLFVIEPKVWPDSRGYFFESFKKDLLEAHHINCNWLQDNEASSTYGVVRGLHFQKPPYAQTKLIRAIVGEILDVVVDCRPDKATYGKVFSIKLTEENKKQLLVPRGFAHAYSVLSEKAIVQYKVDNVYNKASEGGIYLLDETLNIDWGVPKDTLNISDKDKELPSFNALESIQWT